MKDYDYIIAGGGLSGTMLLYCFLKSTLNNKKFLLIEMNRNTRKPHHWSFWLNEKTFFDQILIKKWQKFSVTFPDSTMDFSINNYYISLLDSKDYYAFIYDEFKHYQNIDIVDDKVVDILEAGEQVHVYTENAHFVADYVFDSTYPHYEEDEYKTAMTGASVLVRTKKDAFDPSVIQFIDFRGSPDKELFFYSQLPLTSKQVIIETAHSTSNRIIKETKYNQLLRKYIEKTLHVREYEIVSSRFASIPLGMQNIQHIPGSHTIKIGEKAGIVHPTTSYGFVNIYKDSKLIVESFERTGSLHYRFKIDWLEKYLNKAMLQLMETDPQAVKQLFKELFASCEDGDQLLAYLNSELSFFRTLMLVKNVNPAPLIKSGIR